MTKLAKRQVLWTGLVVWGLFFPIAYLVPRNDLYVIVGALTFASAGAVLHAYWPAVKLVLNKSNQEASTVDLLTLGIMCTWVGTMVRMGYGVYLRGTVAEMPSEFLGLIPPFFQWIVFTGALLHLSARRVIKGTVPQMSFTRLIVAIGLGLALGAWLALSN